MPRAPGPRRRHWAVPWPPPLPGGVRTWSTERSTTLMAAGRPATTRRSQNAFIMPKNQSAQNAANNAETPSVTLNALDRRSSLALDSAGRRHRATMARRNKTIPKEVRDRQADRAVDVEVLQDLHGHVAAKEPRPAGSRPSGSNAGPTRRWWGRPAVSDCWAKAGTSPARPRGWRRRWSGKIPAEQRLEIGRPVEEQKRAQAADGEAQQARAGCKPSRCPTTSRCCCHRVERRRQHPLAPPSRALPRRAAGQP